MRHPLALRERTRCALSERSFHDLLERLRRVRGLRAPFARLADGLIRDSLASFLPKSGPIVEIGMGDGWLRERLPETVQERVIHTEPLTALIESYRQNRPDVAVLPASADQLPFADGELSAVVGCCVLDVVDDGTHVTRELARVLRPGGVLMHWLDMSTRLNEIFVQLARTTLVPIPNVFTDPSATRWPEDLFLAQRHELEIVLEVLARHRHPLSDPLGQYLALFSTAPFPLRAAIAEFVKLVESAELRRSLRSLFKTAAELADAGLRPQLAAFFGRPVSSARHFERRLKQWFLPEAGFRVEHSDVSRAWELDTRDPDDPFVYQSSCVGEQRQLPSVPDSLLCSDAKLPTEAQSLRELGIFTLMARRC